MTTFWVDQRKKNKITFTWSLIYFPSNLVIFSGAKLVPKRRRSKVYTRRSRASATSTANSWGSSESKIGSTRAPKTSWSTSSIGRPSWSKCSSPSTQKRTRRSSSLTLSTTTSTNSEEPNSVRSLRCARSGLRRTQELISLYLCFRKKTIEFQRRKKINANMTQIKLFCNCPSGAILVDIFIKKLS